MKPFLSTLWSFFSKESDDAKEHQGWGLIGFVIIGLVGGFYFFHVDTQQEYLTKRNFRILELWNEELTNKIQSFESVFDLPTKQTPLTLLQSINGSNKRGGVFGPKNTERPDLKNTKPHQSITTEWVDLSCFMQDEINQNGQGPPFYLAYRHLCDTGLTNISLTSPRSGSENSSEGLFVESSPSSHAAKFSLTYTKAISNSKTLSLSAELNLDEFLHNMTNGSAFDDVLIFDSKGKVIYQKSTIELNWNNWGQLWEHTIPQSTSSFLNMFNSESDQEVASRARGNAFADDKRVNVKPLPTAFTISVSDTDYEVFAQASDHLSNSKEFLVICGIVSTDRFKQDILAISSTSLLLIMTFFGILVLSLPLLRLKMIGPTDPLRLSHTFTLVLSSFLGAGFLTFLFLDFAIYKEAKSTVHTQIQDTADSIRHSIDNELTEVLMTLRRYDMSPELTRQVELLAPHNSPETILLEEGITRPCEIPRNPLTCYRDYLYAFWTDHDGNLRINWTNRNDQEIALKGVIDSVSLRGRQYVDHILNHKKRLWHFDSNGLNTQFYLEPITSWTTGWNSVVASIPSQHAREGQKNFGVAAMEFKFRSLMKDLVVPPQAGFAIIRNDNYQVLFHSITGRNLRENFWTETDYNPLLRDLTFARTPGHFEGKYWGEDTNFYVMPISPMPWSIVVFQKREMLRSVNFVILLISGGMFGIYVLITLLGAGFLMGFFQWEKHRKTEWLWPQEKHDKKYAGIVASNILACMLGLLLVSALGNSPGFLLLTGIFYPLLAFGVIAWLLTCAPHVITDLAELVRLKLPTSYAWMMTSFLALGAILPALFIFKAVFFQEMSLVVKHQLMDLYQDAQVRNFHPNVAHASNRFTFVKNVQNLTDCKTRDLPYGIYPNVFVATQWCISSSEPNKQIGNSPSFDSLYRMVSQHFVPLRKGIQEWGFLHHLELKNDAENESNDAKNESKVLPNMLPVMTQTGLRITLDGPFTYQVDENQTDTHYLKIWATVPVQPWILLSSLPSFSSTDIPWWLLMFLLFTAYAAILYTIPRFISDQVLFLSYSIPPIGTFPPQLLQEGNGHSPNLIILGYPGQGKTSLFNNDNYSSCSKSPSRFDLRNSANGKDWKTTIEEKRKNRANDVVILDHFEWRSEELTINQAKLNLLESLLGWEGDREDSSQAESQDIRRGGSSLNMNVLTDKKDIST